MEAVRGNRDVFFSPCSRDSPERPESYQTHNRWAPRNAEAQSGASDRQLRQRASVIICSNADHAGFEVGRSDRSELNTYRGRGCESAPGLHAERKRNAHRHECHARDKRKLPVAKVIDQVT